MILAVAVPIRNMHYKVAITLPRDEAFRG
jgi:hypothetical protein